LVTFLNCWELLKSLWFYTNAPSKTKLRTFKLLVIIYVCTH
jgi:hypothetical protein